MALVEREDRDGLAVLTLNRPEVLNALSPALFVELRSHLDALASATDRIGCVMLAARGRSFSAGNDLKAIQAGETAPSRHFQAETLDALEQLPQPVIAAVQGHCYTGALELALACDLIVAAEDAKFADTHGRWGMSPTWGMSQRLPRRIGLTAYALASRAFFSRNAALHRSTPKRMLQNAITQMIASAPPAGELSM